MKVLLIRRDNIGDLICTTPLLIALRERYPDAQLDLYVNSYNAPVIKGHYLVNTVYVYTKLKHRDLDTSAFAALMSRFKVLWRMRCQRYDLVILAGQAGVIRMLATARRLGAGRIIGFTGPYAMSARPSETFIARPEATEHEVLSNFRLLAPLGITGSPPQATIALDPALCAGIRQKLETSDGFSRVRGLTAIHISARKPSQRWPVESWVALINVLAAQGEGLLLFWSPGVADDAHHPGDDAKAAEIIAALPADVPLFACPTRQLDELIAGLSLARRVVCSDGGAMHVAAALGKPIVCFFGQSDPRVWHPWGVAHCVLQAPSCDVADVPVDEALAALASLSH
ncbi:glycosyl transferase family 9 [Jeongeupia sp. HS-3]|uniref:glycosyltransferase family 9 protein n=1 Tax=Jeongeupia sp. HS-3 TaxID=1009682 RepID=UPI0018A5CDDB|nr:glycosyltransferase family 9 protein [Jeongeupia sp. HS-3]BCL76903.1 glycosyl transferase family 9 [Jeongeupia sp. HS-3]